MIADRMNSSGTSRDEARRPEVVMFSFGFKHGVPIDATVLLDVRFLPNPYWDLRLRPRAGNDPEVAAYVLDNEAGSRLLQTIRPMLRVMVEQLGNGSSRALRVAIGCTGGRHRSVAVVEELGRLMAADGVDVRVFHRDCRRE